MTVSEALLSADIERADAEVLLSTLLRRDRAWLLAHAGDAVDERLVPQFRIRCARRRDGEPASYITGERSFFGRDFRVDRSTLIPRNATEHLVERALHIIDHPVSRMSEASNEVDADIVIGTYLWGDGDERVRTIIDVGTGSGCIAVTIACERDDLSVIAIDKSAEAIAVAHHNVYRHDVENRIRIHCGSLLKPVHTLREPFLIVSNPPYVPASSPLPRDVRNFEPAQALFGGPDGLSIIRTLCTEAVNHPFCRGMIIEHRADQTATIRACLPS